MAETTDLYPHSVSDNQSAVWNDSADNLTAIDTFCNYEPKSSEIRLWMVGVCGTSVCVVSLLENTLLVYLFLTRPRFRTTHLYYMSWLACTDIFMAIAYVLLLSVYNVLVDVTMSLVLYRAVITYLRPMFAVSMIAMVTSSNLICAASLERFFRTMSRTQHLWMWMKNHRLAVAILSVLLGVLTRSSVFFEFEVERYPFCEGNFGEYQLGINIDLISNHLYGFYRFYVRNIITVLLPFAILFCCNSFIVFTLRKRASQSARRSSQKISNAAVYQVLQKQACMNLNSATRMLILVVLSYLLARSLDVFITVWEYFDHDTLSGGYAMFYALSVDMISLLTMVSTTLRLPIYCFCNVGIRQEVKIILGNLFRPICVCLYNKNKELERKQQQLDWNLQFIKTWDRPAIEKTLRPQDSREDWSLHKLSTNSGNTNYVLHFKPELQTLKNGKHLSNGHAMVAAIEPGQIALRRSVINGAVAQTFHPTEQLPSPQYDAAVSGAVSLPFVDDNDFNRYDSHEMIFV
uniref:G-protein coupled receptors family 1 profile domain-containing protein n=1 Tax=Plectus sambesii TaxID=2011161 RepID=A0A914WU96_9BILA